MGQNGRRPAHDDEQEKPTNDPGDGGAGTDGSRYHGSSGRTETECNGQPEDHAQQVHGLPHEATRPAAQEQEHEEAAEKEVEHG